MTLYIIIGIGAALVATLMLGQKIGGLKERAKNAEIQANQSKKIAEIAARPHAAPTDILDLMRDDKM